ncbi:antibiotic biosynthesis monooxygenase (plasmid) [Ensifer sp. PDNC004]|uniref:putative quinol monooxygenase n=1 Tax=Ensifer sp. PDNC004 TaxID=2811423 RepID=UPI001965A1A2|nr:putative quinol monooxygenase [Ensifer sp. PDNC004]QRY70882.1 antibiotic biosynthesis monooxygenase [Ensifer sp. PDNC004]
MTTEKVISIAILKAKPHQHETLRQGLLGLIAPTRAEPGNLDYVLFELRDEPGTFYMREAFADQAALDAHFAAPHFQAFAAEIDALLEEPLRLIFLDQVSP